jgi:hypothetical protein
MALIILIKMLKNKSKDQELEFKYLIENKVVKIHLTKQKIKIL